MSNGLYLITENRTRVDWFVSLIFHLRHESGEGEGGAFVAGQLYKVNALLGGIISAQESSDWCTARPRLPPETLRAIQSGSIVAGVGPSPTWSLSKWRCGVGEHESFALIFFLWSTDFRRISLHTISSLHLCNHLWNTLVPRRPTSSKMLSREIIEAILYNDCTEVNRINHDYWTG